MEAEGQTTVEGCTIIIQGSDEASEGWSTRSLGTYDLEDYIEEGQPTWIQSST